MPEMFKYNCICTLTDKAVQRNIGMAIIIDNNPQSWMNYIDELHVKEQLQLDRIITTGAKNSFLLGRIAAKRALNQMKSKNENHTWIDHGVFGFPILEPNPNGIEITLAHTEYAGFSVCFDQRDKLGVDIEEIVEAKIPIIETALTADELALVSRNSIERSLYLHLVWSAREALSKALQTGFLIPLELLAVESIEKKNNFYKITFKHFSIFQVIAFQLNTLICTVAFPERCDLDLAQILGLKEAYENGCCVVE